MTRIWLAAATAVLLGMGVLGMGMFGATPASASSSASSAEAGPSPQVEQLCARLAAAIARIDPLVGRINGGADQPGSLAYLNERVKQAQDRKDGAAAESLRARIDERTERLEYLMKGKDLAVSTQAENCEGVK